MPTEQQQKQSELNSYRKHTGYIATNRENKNNSNMKSEILLLLFSIMSRSKNNLNI